MKRVSISTSIVDPNRLQYICIRILKFAPIWIRVTPSHPTPLIQIAATIVSWWWTAVRGSWSTLWAVDGPAALMADSARQSSEILKVSGQCRVQKNMAW